ncbi:MAG: hypothetical protein MZV63_56675 [Marinilabiliales bacterium]|nr:hypothetical protein [Marinilabiliales bacterium]
MLQFLLIQSCGSCINRKDGSFATPPGSNGEKNFFSISRKMLPNAGGTDFTIPAPGDSVEVILNYVPTSAFLASVNLDSIRVVAFIQNDNTQAGLSVCNAGIDTQIM